MGITMWVDTVGAVVLGLAYAASLEWSVHRFVLHGLGRRRGGRFAFRSVDHHRACRRNQGRDDDHAPRVGAN